MSASPMGEKPRGWFRSAMTRLVTWPSRLSTAGKSSLLMLAFLMLAAVVVWAVFLSQPGHVALRHAFTPLRIILVSVLILLIPVATYFVVRMWLEGDRSRFPEIDFAWNAGLDAMKRAGISLDDVPLYIGIGSPGERVENAMIAVCGDDLRVRGAPEGAAPLHWYAGPDRAYLFLTDPSWLSGLAALAARRHHPGDGPPDAAAGLSPDAAAALAAVATANEGPAAESTGTMALNDFLAVFGATAKAEVTSKIRGAIPTTPGVSNTGTLAFDSFANAQARSSAAKSAARKSSSSLPSSIALEQPALLPTQESSRRIERLEYVLRKLQLARRPLCPTNGVLVMIPFELIIGEANEKEELVRAIRADLKAIHGTLGVRTPVTALIVGLEQEAGFQELVRRVGRERAAVQRFGRRYDPRALPTPPEMVATSAHVCGAFEDWIYSLFREDDALARPGTARLYSLLCRVRSYAKEPLADVLARGFGYDPAIRSDEMPILFSGCYVAATGETEDRRAFLRGVFEKLDAEQEDVEWTPASLAVEGRYRLLTGLITAVNVVLLIVLFGIFAFWLLG